MELETMKIAVLGATGTAGKPVVAELKQAGHEVIELSRSTGVDLTTGEGLVEGFKGAEVCVDVSMPWPGENEDLVEAMAAVTQRIVDAASEAGVQHIVYLSITNLDNPKVAEFEYYQGKLAQEDVLNNAEIATSVVHSAQWMEFALNPVVVEESDDEVKVQDWLIQPVAIADVAKVVAEVAAGAPGDRTVAGPESIRLPDLTRGLLAAKGDERKVTVVDAALPSFADGSLLAPDDAKLVGPTPEKWIVEQG